jgi:hypothetical protein
MSKFTNLTLSAKEVACWIAEIEREYLTPPRRER